MTCSSLYQALEHPGPVAIQTAQGATSQAPLLHRHARGDMRAAIDTDVDREDAIISVSADGRQFGAFGREIVTDFSTPDLEHEQHAMPTERLCDEGMWIIECIGRWEGRDDHPDGSAANLVMRFKAEIMNQFALYRLPVIGLAAPAGSIS